MKSNKLLISLMSLMLIIGWPAMSLAHVHMEKSIPEDGAHLTNAPEKVEVWFSGKVDSEWSAIKVTDASGKRVDTGAVTDDGDPKHLSVGLQPLPAGTYDVKLNVISGDGHRVKGSFTFSVE